MQLMDNYQRRFQYLRLSITELCNFQCQYCLPNGYRPNKDHHFLTLNEIDNIVSTFTELGVHKIRLTGGEPTLRRDFIDILSMIASYPSVRDVAVTTNGSRLLKNVHHWHQAGLSSINISIDSFSPHLFKLITGQDKLKELLQGVEKSLEVGIKKVKINTVLMKNMNDKLSDYLAWIKQRPIELRFIELMETGESQDLFNRYHLAGHSIELQLIEQGWQLQPKQALSGPAKVYFHPQYLGKIGLIMPYSKDFCKSCNRLRVSSIGKLHYCLFGDAAVDLRDLLASSEQKAQLKARILASLMIKPEKHLLHQHKVGITPNLSYIGG
ncbi:MULTISPECIES: GTP 3',8-cyclase MoaA [unclassified Gilliamella]|uniref:GTP 3',8-cyclase MoaA n=1 Tax=unclassified Gilliamella TaxID=2685620 RepID=UPI00226ADE28|nr:MULTISPECIES: GTP 3',8-cyclase MoaA [unclassified Gilliamella]MCX8642794.1 GTP 3',8-cyclase MoaA [Gilliamella sp. B3835]MCX8708247.1 GTP 3',8-cyclase MoaA [Gilliamella sp. B3783]MCX8710145.1 GTP 3',8-cyclase MoaA [Gilliamella sp. B3780]MCX8715421.1 GTP 3',8-cyclase MoaA [Gilliamella sp. B3781]MCX8717442.1 GTP 3',8-cyclase MoaA [Gilliamella sp. B3784]